MLLTENGACLSGHPSLEEEPPPNDRAATRRDGSAHRSARYCRDRAAPQSVIARLGGVLLPRPCQQELSGAGPLHDPSAPPVAVPQAQGEIGRASCRERV